MQMGKCSGKASTLSPPQNCYYESFECLGPKSAVGDRLSSDSLSVGRVSVFNLDNIFGSTIIAPVQL